MEVKDQVMVEAPPEQIWALISDPRNAPLFNRMVQSVEQVEEQVGGLGTRWTAIAQLGGRVAIASEITQWEPPRRLAITMNGPASGTLTFTLTPAGEGSTQVEQQATSNLPAISAPLLKPMLVQNLKESLQQIKVRCEQA